MEKPKKSDSLISGKAAERYFDFKRASVEFHALFNLESRDERAIAVLGGTFLEIALEHILYAFLPEDDKEVVKLFDFNQPLGNLSSKITLSYCLGLIDKIIKDNLNIIRKIRNKFAHDLYARFDDDQIKDWVKDLKFYRVSMMMSPPNDATALMIFQVAVNQLISHLSGCISSSRDEKRKIQDTLKQFLV